MVIPSTLIHICGPLYIQSYGLCIVIALFIFLYAIHKDDKIPLLISSDQISNLTILGIFAGIIGGRVLYIIHHQSQFESWYQYFEIWFGGFSVLGSLIAIVLVIPLYLRYYKIQILKLLDRVGIYAPLLQGIARIGCFVAGCCGGKSMNLSYFNGPITHPTQLYSFTLLITIFCILFYGIQHRFKRDGQIFLIYLLLVSSERFFSDFFRATPYFYPYSIWSMFSFNQWVSLLLIAISGVLFLHTYYKQRFA